MTKDEALKLALEALEVCEQSNYGRNWLWPDTAHPTAMANVKEAITAIKEALAEPEKPKGLLVDLIAAQGPEFVAEMAAIQVGPKQSAEPVEDVVAYHSDETRTVRISPKREWVGLTDEEVMDIAFNFDVPSLVVRTVEFKLKQKNT